MATFFMFKENYPTLDAVAVVVIILRRDTKHVGTPNQDSDRVAQLGWHVGFPDLS